MNAVLSTEAAPAVVPPDDTDRRSRLATTFCVAVVAVVSGLGFVIAYRGGLVVTSGDPIAYIGVARSLAAGHGVSVPYGSGYTQWHLSAGGPVSHWPPGYSLLLSVWSGSILLWARIVAVAVVFRQRVPLRFPGPASGCAEVRGHRTGHHLCGNIV